MSKHLQRPVNGTPKEYLEWLRELLKDKGGSLDLPGMVTYHLPPLSEQTREQTKEKNDAR